MQRVLVKDLATTVGKTIEFIHGNVYLSGVVIKVAGTGMVLNAGFNAGYDIHLDTRLIRDEYVTVLTA